MAMEQALYWMHKKRRHIFTSRIQSSSNPSYGDSWEEQAFSEDAAGALGGCIWPPRSYSCSFCRREFRSAQALGGHMNVHRRDRARLKQSLNPHNQIPHLQHQNHHINLQYSSTSLDVQYPSQTCTLDCNSNPSSHDHSVLASTSSPSRVSAPSLALENFSDQKKLVLPFSSPNFLENHKGTYLSSSLPSWSNLVAKRNFQISDPENEDRNSKQGPGHRATGDYVKADLSSLNFVALQTLPTVSGTAKDEAMSRKRRRTDSIPLPSLLKLSGSVDRQHPKSEVLEFKPSSIEDLDLELRLGSRN